MRADRPGHLRLDIGLDQLGAPIAVIGANKSDDADIVQQAGQHDLLVHAGPDRMPGALQQMIGRAKAVFEEIDQGRPLRHLRQARIVAHQHMSAGVFGHQRRAVREAHIAVGEVEQARFDDDRLVEFAHHLVLDRVGALGQAQCIVHVPGAFF